VTEDGERQRERELKERRRCGEGGESEGERERGWRREETGSRWRDIGTINNPANVFGRHFAARKHHRVERRHSAGPAASSPCWMSRGCFIFLSLGP
jgi:hypothetical protein